MAVMQDTFWWFFLYMYDVSVVFNESAIGKKSITSLKVSIVYTGNELNACNMTVY